MMAYAVRRNPWTLIDPPVKGFLNACRPRELANPNLDTPAVHRIQRLTDLLM